MRRSKYFSKVFFLRVSLDIGVFVCTFLRTLSKSEFTPRSIRPSLQCLRNGYFRYGSPIQGPYCARTGLATRENRESGPSFLLRGLLERPNTRRSRRLNWSSSGQLLGQPICSLSRLSVPLHRAWFFIIIQLESWNSFASHDLAKVNILFFETHSVRCIQRRYMFLPIRKYLI